MSDYLYRRKIRITTLNKKGSVLMPDVVVQDADTGEYISGIYRMVITLDARAQINEAKIFYYETNEKGHFVTGEDGRLAEKTIKVQNVEIDDVTAFEIMDNIRKEQNPWQ